MPAMYTVSPTARQLSKIAGLGSGTFGVVIFFIFGISVSPSFNPHPELVEG
jgi:hypothetical protein